MRLIEFIIGIWSIFVFVVSGEWMFRLTRRPNGGDMVLFRAIWITSLVFLAVVYIKRWIDPRASSEMSIDQLRCDVTNALPWFGAIFAGVYASLYARFASQWTYLANLYNKIKETQVRGVTKTARIAMAEWKAGFLEDAQLVHLSTHRVFVSVVRKWGSEREVKQAFHQNCPRGTRRFDHLMHEAESRLRREGSKYAYKDWLKGLS